MSRIPTPIAVLLIVAVAGLLRWPGMCNELWLDEIWSLDAALKAHSWTDVFLAMRVDNNHHLNTLWLYIVGMNGTATSYRLLSFAAGLGTVVAAYAIGLERSAREATVTAVMVAISFPLVYYASEARGYGPVVFFTLLAWWSLRRFVHSQRWPFALLFWVSCILGVLSHQTFLEFFVVALVWCDAQAQRLSRRTHWRITVRAFAVPAIAFALLYAFSFRGTVVAGGPSISPLLIVGQTLALLVGGPEGGIPMWMVAGGVAIAFAISARIAWQAQDDDWGLWLAVGVFMPALFLLVQSSSISYTRYFLVPSTFVLLGLARLVTRAVEAKSLPGVAAVAALTLMLAGCLRNVVELAVLGRGRFDEAVAMMAQGDGASVAFAPDYSDFDERGAMLIAYYTRAAGLSAHLHYAKSESSPTAGTDWIVREQIGDSRLATPTYLDAFGHQYEFVREFPAYRLAGIGWRLYKRRPQG